MRDSGSPTRLGLRANLAQFCLLVLVNALVGGMVGQEQTVLPLLAQQDFHLTGYIFLLSYVLAFGITKAATNYLAGTWSDRLGRKPVLILSGRQDPIVPADNADALASMLSTAGAKVDHRILPAGHQLSQADVALSRTWVTDAKRGAAAA